MLRVIILVSGIIAAAALDRRLGWGTFVSVAMGLYCHRVYGRPVPAVPGPTEAEDDGPRPGWAARWTACGPDGCAAPSVDMSSAGRAPSRVAGRRQRSCLPLTEGARPERTGAEEGGDELVDVTRLDIDLLRAEEVARSLRIGRTKAYEMMAAGELPVVRLGRCVRVPRRRLEEWIKARIVGGDGAWVESGLARS